MPVEAVSAVVTADWTLDGAPDRAALVEREGAADLYLFVSTGQDAEAADGAEGGGMTLVHALPGFAWRGAAWGTQPELGLSGAGSLEVVSGNLAIGRSRWQETVTIAWRDGRFVVAGFTFESHDTLDPGLSKDCDVNFLAGRGVLDGEAFPVARRGGIPLEAWSAAEVPPECAAG